MVEYLVNQMKANINCKENEGNTPLFAASANGYLDIVEFFVN